jgi:hypothetical protein
MVQIDNMGNLGKIISINISQHKGIDKTPVVLSPPREAMWIILLLNMVLPG